MIATRTSIDGDFRARIEDLECDIQELAERLLLLPPAELVEFVKLTFDHCSDAIKKSLQALPPMD